MTTTTNNNTINAMEVICIKNRAKKLPQITEKGNKYFLDRASIYMDCDGDAYGTFYDCEGKRLGNFALKRFQTIRMSYELRIYC